VLPHLCAIINTFILTNQPHEIQNDVKSWGISSVWHMSGSLAHNTVTFCTFVMPIMLKYYTDIMQIFIVFHDGGDAERQKGYRDLVRDEIRII